MQTIARSMADTGPTGGRYMPHAPPIVGRYGKRPHSRMRRLQLRTVHDLISSPRAFAELVLDLVQPLSRMKSTSKKRIPSIVNLTVKRRYLTQREIERLMDCARKHGRYGH